jgi:phosphoribosylformylglycinamidine (FGAM) synthase-like enzyme
MSLGERAPLALCDASAAARMLIACVVALIVVVGGLPSNISIGM